MISYAFLFDYFYNLKIPHLTTFKNNKAFSNANYLYISINTYILNFRNFFVFKCNFL